MKKCIAGQPISTDNFHEVVTAMQMMVNHDIDIISVTPSKDGYIIWCAADDFALFEKFDNELHPGDDPNEETPK